MNAVAGFFSNLPWARYLPPATTRELLTDQLFAAVGFLVIALILAAARRKSKPFDMAAVLRAMVSGASFPPALTLAVLPLYPEIQTLFGEATMQAYLMIAGLILSVLSIYGLLK